MTDLERFVELYASFGIDCKVYTDPETSDQIILFGVGTVLPFPLEYATESEKFDGYVGFRSEIIFDAEGKFVSQGFWE